jgi:Xaa-Pro dipeptidase
MSVQANAPANGIPNPDPRAELLVPKAEIARRYKALRECMAKEGLDAVLVCGNQYAGFEGAVRYVSGFEIVHRYVYVVLPLEGEPTLVFPSEARWIGDKRKPWVQKHVWADIPGQWLREYGEHQGWKRVGVHGMSYVMPVRDYIMLESAPFLLLPFDAPFDLARAVKSEWELTAIRRGLDIITDGFWELLRAYEPGKTEA